MSIISKSIVDLKLERGYTTDSYKIEKQNVITSVRMKVEASDPTHSVSYNFIVPLITIDFRDFIEFEEMDSSSLITICENTINRLYREDYEVFERNLIKELNYLSSNLIETVTL